MMLRPPFVCAEPYWCFISCYFGAMWRSWCDYVGAGRYTHRSIDRVNQWDDNMDHNCFQVSGQATGYMYFVRSWHSNRKEGRCFTPMHSPLLLDSWLQGQLLLSNAISRLPII